MTAFNATTGPGRGGLGKRSLVALLLVLVCTLALALPTPKDIETAVNTGQLSQAETMLREVLQEKPQSARAHYELAQVLARTGRKIEARAQMLEAQKIEPSLKFASDPQRFRDLLSQLSAGDATPNKTPSAKAEPVRTPAAAAPTAAAPTSSFPWFYVLLGAGVLALIGWSMARRSAAAAAGNPASAASDTAFGRYATQGAGTTTGYPMAPSGVPAAPASGVGSGLTGAVIGGVAGLAAGYGLAKAFGNDNESSPAAAATNQPPAADGLVPFDAAPAQQNFGAFDAGSGDSWDSGSSSSSSSDDNW